jgi:hypothetical protein
MTTFERFCCEFFEWKGINTKNKLPTEGVTFEFIATKIKERKIGFNAVLSKGSL